MTKILVIEDEDDIRENLLELLDAEGYETVGAENGIIGLEAVREETLDLIICDVLIPDLDGYGVLEAVRREPLTATIPFIFLTAKAAKSDLRQGMEWGADDYLTKPFTRAELLGAIAARLEKHAVMERGCQKQLDALRLNLTLALPHELRTPLNGILTGSQLLIEEVDFLDKQEILELAGDIRYSAERLYRLIQNFLLYAQLELLATDATQIELLRQTSKTESAKSAIARAAIQKAKDWARESDLELDLHDDSISISAPKLEKIVEEITDNAFKFSQHKTSIRVVSRCENNTFVLSITDKGKGMTADQIATIGAYMRFERKLSSQQGSGLGLLIAKRLAELHGGTLQIESIPGKETIVFVCLPIST